MAQFIVSTRMGFGGGTLPDAYKWTNKWFVEAGSVLEAADLGYQLWRDTLRAAHNQACFCYEVYASDANPATQNYTVKPVPLGEQRGTLFGVDNTEFYNPNVCVRLEFSVAGGRASRKFLRPGLQEAWMGSGGTNISASAVVTAISNAASVVATLGYLRDESGNGFVTGTLDAVTTRKLGKQSRANMPVFPPFG